MITLTGRTLKKTVEPRIGLTLLTMAQAASVDWQFNCSRGTCARCRCFIAEGAGHLSEPTDEEWDRLGQAELEAGYRLGCQASIVEVGNVHAINKTYF